MANNSYISKVNLPNDPTTYYIKDEEARDSLLQLQNEFVSKDGDTIDGTLNVTDVNAGTLLVTGNASFVNGLHGDLDGNATSAITATKANKVIDSNNNSTEITITSSKTAQTTTSNLASWNGNEIGKISPETLKEVMSLDNVENKSSATIRGELTKKNVTDALGYTPPTEDTDTHYTTHIYAGNGTAANSTSDLTNPKIAVADNTTVAGTNGYIQLKGSGATTVTAKNGVVTIDSADTWTPMVGATASANGTGGYISAVPPSDGWNTKFLRADGTWAVPPDEDTHNIAYLYAGTSTSAGNAPSTNGNTCLKLKDGNTTSTIKIVGDGLTSVSSNIEGAFPTITISTDNPPNVSTNAAGLAPKLPNDATKYLNGVGSWVVPTPDINALSGYPLSVDNGGTGGENPMKAANNLKVQSLGQGTQIGSSSQKDLNKYKTVGNYYCSINNTANSLTNKPADLTTSFIMRVGFASGHSIGTINSGSTSYWYQEIIRSVDGVRWYRRTKTNVTQSDDSAEWYDWLQYSPIASISLTGDVTGSIDYNGSDAWSIATTIANSSVTNGKLANDSITIAGNELELGQSLDAPTLVTSLGLSTAMHFIGRATVARDNANFPAITNYTPSSGDVVLGLNDNIEYVYDGTSWLVLGAESSYKTLQTQVNDPSASGSSSQFISSITQNSNGEISVTKKNLPTIELTGAITNVNELSNDNSTLTITTTIPDNSLSRSKMMMTDMMNYAELNDYSASLWGFTTDTTAVDGHWYSINNSSYSGRTKPISPMYQCVGGETFNIQYEICHNTMGTPTEASGGGDPRYTSARIALVTYNDNLVNATSTGNVYATGTTGDENSTLVAVNCNVTLSENARRFKVHVYRGGSSYTNGGYTGTIKIRKLKVTRVSAPMWYGDLSGTATTATNVATQSTSAILNTTQRHIWFSSSNTETQRAYSDNFYYVSQTNTVHANLDGNAATADTATTADALSGFKISTTTNLGIDATDINQAIGHVSGLTSATWNNQQTIGALYRQVYSADQIHQIFGDYSTGHIAVRGRKNGTWGSWHSVIDEDNWSSYITLSTLGLNVVSKTANGLAPQLPDETTTTKYLCQDGTWKIPIEIPVSIDNGGTGGITKQEAANNLQVASLGHGIAITGNDSDPNKNIDDIITIGNYYCSGNATVRDKLSGTKPANLEDKAFTLKVGYSTGTGYKYQELRRFTDGVTWYRRKNGNDTTTWTNWVQYSPLESITLTGDAIGTATASGGAWSITSTVNKITSLGRHATSLNDIDNNTSDYESKIAFLHADGTTTNKPGCDANGAGGNNGNVINIGWDNTSESNKYGQQILLSNGNATGTTPTQMYIRGRHNNNNWDEWREVLNSGNWNNYVTKSALDLDNVENKSVATLKSEILTSANIVSALGYTPLETVTAKIFAGSGTANNSTTTNTNTYITIASNSSVATSNGSIKIQGNGDVSVTSDNTGTITVSCNDTHNTAYIYAGTSTGNANATTTDGNTHIILKDGSSVSSRVKITGDGATSVVSDANGTITISSTNTWTPMTGATASADGTAGYVSAPPSNGYNTKYLRADGTWAIPPYLLLSGGTLTGALYGDEINVNATKSKTTGGLGLYGNNSGLNYSIMMRGTDTTQDGLGTHGYVTGDWATYFNQAGVSGHIDDRGWIFRGGLKDTGILPVASISSLGQAVFNGSVTVGGNAANTSGCRLEFDNNLSCLNFVFN